MVSIAQCSKIQNNEKPSLQLCPNCKCEHKLSNCPKFLELTYEQRLELLPKLKVCFNCLRSGHYANNCRTTGCKICKKRHNVLIHIPDLKYKPTTNVCSNTEDRSALSPANPTQSSDEPSGNVTLSAQLSTYLPNRTQQKVVWRL
ncbi:uncharacterized protein LOC123721112 [Papilio machaon]|uniref:uncharacterized protein LOC123721112 n=1 Tax=Papilio machaon TaxID=76193 RepID=UPI001E664F58|nr:uncharacterized protein LOC123721112 [Papilio machaon]